MSVRRFVLPMALGLFTPVAWAGDTAEGEALVRAQDCTSCHARMVGGDGSGLYTRADRKVTTPAKLAAQVSFCSIQLKTGWFPEEEAHVAAWLNQRYYHFH